MNIYADTSFCLTYISDANSQKADVWRQDNAVPLDFTGLHRLEFRNALSLAQFQQRLTAEEVQAAWLAVQQDIDSGLLVSKDGLWGKVFSEAEGLAQKHTPTLGSRTLDILHVAGALVLGSTDFCTFDERQGKLAQLAGFRVHRPELQSPL